MSTEQAGQGGYRAAVLGSPIAHSLSPVLHRAAYARLGLPGWRYDRYEVDEAALPGFMAAPPPGGPGEHWAGLSLTMPLKRAIFPLLDRISEEARAVSAVNTVVFAADGSRRGENTDVPGLVAALAERAVRRTGSAAVLGGGATASSALAALARIATGPVEIYLRSVSRIDELEPIAERLGVEVRARAWAHASEAFDHELVINTTPSGAADALADRLPAKVGTLFDVLYHPWPTVLAAAWSAVGGTLLGGRDLLVHQAALQVELMTADRLPADAGKAERADLVAVMRAALADG
jgi:shikimate dehydrogenase